MAAQNFRVKNGLTVGNTEITAATGNVTVAGNLTVLNETFVGNIGNLRISGGSFGYYTVTDGLGNLSFAPTSPPANAVQTFTFAGNVNSEYGNTQFANIYLADNYSATTSLVAATCVLDLTSITSILLTDANVRGVWSGGYVGAGGFLTSGTTTVVQSFITNLTDVLNNDVGVQYPGIASAVLRAGTQIIDVTFVGTLSSQPVFRIQQGTGTTTLEINGAPIPGGYLGNTNSWTTGSSSPAPTYQFSIPSYPGYAGNANVWVAPASGATAQTAVADFYTAFSQASNGVFTLANNPSGVANSFSINFNSNNSSFTMGLTQTNTGASNTFVSNTTPTGSVNTVNYDLEPSPTPVLFDTVTFTDPLTSQTAITRLYPGNTIDQALSVVTSAINANLVNYLATRTFNDITLTRRLTGQLIETQFPSASVNAAVGGNSSLSTSNTIVSYGQSGFVGQSSLFTGSTTTSGTGTINFTTVRNDLGLIVSTNQLSGWQSGAVYRIDINWSSSQTGGTAASYRADYALSTSSSFTTNVSADAGAAASIVRFTTTPNNDYITATGTGYYSGTGILYSTYSLGIASTVGRFLVIITRIA